MGAIARSLVVRIIGDSSSLEKEFRKAANGTQRFERTLGRTTRGAAAGSGIFRGLGRSVAFASASFLGGFGFVAAVKSAFDEMSKAQQAAAQTNAAIRSTGGVAGVTAEHVDTLAKSLLNLTGVDDEAVKGAENLLLTFTNIRNVAGKNNDVFDQATKSVLDLSVRFKKDLGSSAILVGRALNDPVRGLTALQRAGVQFTAQQRKQIKALVESGHTLEAQKIILRELKTETGGAAEAAGNTLAGKLNKLRETVRNVAGEIALQFLPAITKIVDRAVAWITNLENQRRVLDDVKQVVGAVTDVFNTLRGAFEDLNKITGSTKNTLKLLFGVLVLYKTLRLAGVLAGIASNVGLIGTNAKTASGEVAGLRGSLAKLKGIGPIVIGVTIALAITEATKGPRKKAKDKAGPFGFLLGTLDPRDPSFVGKDFEKSVKNLGNALKRSVDQEAGKGLDPFIVKLFRKLVPATKKASEDARLTIDQALKEHIAQQKHAAEVIRGAQAPGAIDPSIAAAERQARNAAFDDRIGRLIDRVQDAPLQQQVRKLQRIAVLIQQRIDATKGIQRKLDLEDKLIQVSRQAAEARSALVQAYLDRLAFNVDKAAATAGVNDDIAQLRILNAALAKRIKAGGDTLALEQQQFQVQQDIIAAQKKRRDARQFRFLGFGPEGEDLIPGVKSLKRQVASVRDALSGSFLDSAKNRNLLDRIGKLLTDPAKWGKLSADVRAKVQQILADLKGQLKQSGVDVTRFQKTATGQFALAGAHGAGARGGITINGGVHLHGIKDLNELEDAIRRRHKQRAHARRAAR